MSDHAIDPRKAGERPPVIQLLRQLIQIGIALTSERELAPLLERIVTEARRFTNAEAGTLYLRDGEGLRFAAAQNDVLVERLGEGEMRRQFAAEPLRLTQPSLAGYVALTGQAICLPDAYGVPKNRPYVFNQDLDVRLHYQTGSVLVVPLQDASRDVIGVLQLINTRNAAGEVVPFDAELESLVQALASQAAVAIRNARLEELSFKDPLTGVYNRRYFTLRLEEEAKRHARFAEPLSLVLLDIDRFKAINDRAGHLRGDALLRDLAEALVDALPPHVRTFRLGGDEFAILAEDLDAAGITALLEPVRKRAAEVGVAFSAGAAAVPEHADSGPFLRHAADLALCATPNPGACEPRRHQILGMSEGRVEGWGLVRERVALAHRSQNAPVRPSARKWATSSSFDGRA